MIKRVCSALFVDFDNIYITLNNTYGPEYALEFATNPARWLSWLEQKMSTAHLPEEGVQRKILIRKCYLNPASFNTYRGHFIRSAFEVIDCPPLTERGKTSADIRMVMDIMDTLHMDIANSAIHYDEFIILSADADFTPVMLRVRMHNRSSVILAVGMTSPAYKAACDYLPPLGLFFEEGLGMSQGDDEDEDEAAVMKPPTNGLGPVLDQLASLLITHCKGDRDGRLPADQLPALYLTNTAFRQGKDWLGYFSLRALTHAITQRCRELVTIDDKLEGTWYIALRSEEKWDAEPEAAQLNLTPALPLDAAALTPAPRNGDGNGSGNGHKREQIAAFIRTQVHASDEPVVIATLATEVSRQFGPSNDGKWFGATSFRELLEQLNLTEFRFYKSPPGYIYDPLRHSVPAEPPAAAWMAAPAAHTNTALRSGLKDKFDADYPDIQPLAYKVHNLTDLPYLMPDQFATVFALLARTVNEREFNLAWVTKTLRDRCVERGIPLSRADANFLVIGIHYVGYELGKAEETGRGLAELVLQNAVNLCQSAQFMMTDDEKKLLRRWLCEGKPSE